MQISRSYLILKDFAQRNPRLFIESLGYRYCSEDEIYLIFEGRLLKYDYKTKQLFIIKVWRKNK